MKGHVAVESGLRFEALLFTDRAGELRALAEFSSRHRSTGGSAAGTSKTEL